jgi:asparagine synthase (glutamine-hydrolysing)
MCGILGVASSARLVQRDWLAEGAARMAHRGPDDAGFWWSADGRVGLAQRRLAIVDLSANGHQPMADPLTGRMIVFNGEIYNHRELRTELAAAGRTFRSESDTEVLLAGYDIWGEALLDRLVGMFAFAIYDPHASRVLLARDRAGEKPLFYHLHDGALRFSSELKGLLADPSLERRIDPAAFDHLLMVGYVPGPACLLRGFAKLQAGHALSLDLENGAVRMWRYWCLPPQSAAAAVGEGEDDALLDELERLLEASVRAQMVADVPVGILLSGGVDSSLVTAMAVRASSRVRTFTIGFPGHGALDETEHARLIARHFGTEHTELPAGQVTAEILPRLARQYDEPLVDSSMLPTFLVSELVRGHCTVALGGDGGDELFGGYGHYSRLLWLQRRLGPIPLPLRRMVAWVASRLLPVGFKGRNYLLGLDVDFASGLPLVASLFDDQARAGLLGGGPTPASRAMRDRVPREASLLQRATRMDFLHYLAEDILVKVDRASMLASLEMRAPFLDHRLIEFAFAKVPDRLKASPAERKILLKRLCARILPPEFDRQRKQGFSIPLAQWLRQGPFRDLFHQVLLDPGCPFDRRAVAGLLDGQDRGRNNSERLFGLVIFELWRREYGVAF